MDDFQRPPLPWEAKTAIGALALVALQQFHEICLLVVGSDRLGLAHLGPISLLLLALAAGAALGLLRRRSWALRTGIYLVGAFALLHLALLVDAVTISMEAERGTGQLASTDYDYFIGPTLNPFGLFWAVSRAALLIAAPLLLLLGELRTRLRRN